MNGEKTKCKVGRIPFYFTPIITPNNPNSLPNVLDMTLEVKDGVISQEKSAGKELILNRAYEFGSSISGLMDDFGIGKAYADEFFHYVTHKIGTLEGKKILEIGCGSGYLLSQLRNCGADCVGIEPGENAAYGSEKYGLKIIQDFFKKEYFAEKFDSIIFYCVLEHIYETEKFLNEVVELLQPDGKILLAVPNCESSIKDGDISMLLCEHWHYYTRDSLSLTLALSGLAGDIEITDGGGSIFGCLTRRDRLLKSSESYMQQCDRTEREILLYESKFKNTCLLFDNFLKKSCRKSIGVYVPGRLINILAVLGEKNKNLRFFDDNCLLFGTYYPGFDIPIENFEQFIDNPTDIVFIASYTFGNIIKEKILTRNIDCEVITLGEFLNENSNSIGCAW